MKKQGAEWDEFSFIREITANFSNIDAQIIVGNGDDAAVFQTSSGKQQVVCIDTMVEQIHFTRKTSSFKDIGYKSVAVNISDIAAMGGVPRFFLTSIAIPKRWQKQELVEIYQGMQEISREWEMSLLGGDTVSTSDALVITVTAIGEVEAGRSLVRSSAQPGDVVFLTGYPGESAAGLYYLLHLADDDHALELEEELPSFLKVCLQAHRRPSPQVTQGRILATYAEEHKISLNDVSDGLASELNEIAQASGVNLLIDKNSLPVSEHLIAAAQYMGLDAYDCLLYGGEDYLLVGTLPSHLWPNVEKDFRQAELPIWRIGSVEAGSGEVFLQEGGAKAPLKKAGYNHFQRTDNDGKRMD